MLNVHFSEETKTWAAFFSDDIGQLGGMQHGNSPQEAAFRLGTEMGCNPNQFARPMAEYFAKDELSKTI
jgi:hypothetical protein